MFTIRLEGPYGRWSKLLAPAACFRAVGPSIRNGENDREVAVYRSGRWHRTSCSGSLLVLTGPFSALSIDSAIELHLEDPHRHESRDILAAKGLRIVNAELRLQGADQPVLARLDESTGQWLFLDDNRAWPVIVFRQNNLLSMQSCHDTARDAWSANSH